jgi:flotillin
MFPLAFLGINGGQVLSVVLVLFLLGVLGLILKLLANQYIRVPPNEVLVKYGRQYRSAAGQMEGFKLVPGGAAFVVPMLEKYQMLPLDAFQVKFQVTNVPSEEGVLVTVAAVSSLKIGTEHTLLDAAVRRFLSRDTGQITEFAREVLEGGLRGVVATMKVEELVKERTAFGNKVQEQVTQDLTKLGLVVDNFLIQDINDEGGYIKALGVKRTAEVKRDASIAQAEANRDQAIRVAEAERDAAQKSAEARRIGETAKALADQQVSDAQKERDVKIATNTALVKAEQAKIEIAAKIAAAQKDRDLRTAQVSAEEAEVVARTALQLQEKKRHDAELEAAVIVQANREREAIIIQAEAKKQASILTAEGQRKAIEELAEAERVKREREADGLRAAQEHAATGRKAQAAAQQAELVAEAEGNKAKLLADAEGQKAKLLADAEGQKAQLLAVAAGVAEKAKAYQLLDQTGKLLEILKASPELVEKIGEAVKTAGEGTLAPMAQAIGTGLGNVDEIRITDLGGAANGQDPLTKLVSLIPKAVFNLVQNAHAIPGVREAVIDVFKKAGIDLASALAESKPAEAKPAAIAAAEETPAAG